MTRQHYLIPSAHRARGKPCCFLNFRGRGYSKNILSSAPSVPVSRPYLPYFSQNGKILCSLFEGCIRILVRNAHESFLVTNYVLQKKARLHERKKKGTARIKNRNGSDWHDPKNIEKRLKPSAHCVFDTGPDRESENKNEADLHQASVYTLESRGKWPEPIFILFVPNDHGDHKRLWRLFLTERITERIRPVPNVVLLTT